MAGPTLKSIVSQGKSAVASVSGELENVAGAAGKGAFSVSAGPNGITVGGNFNQIKKGARTPNTIRSPIRELYSNPKVKSPIVFPQDLDNDHYVMFKIMRERRIDRRDRRVIDTFQNIVLPVPSNLTTSYGANYANESLGAFGAMAAGQVGASDIESAGGSIVDKIMSGIGVANQAFSGDTDAATQLAGVLGPGVATAVAGKSVGAVGALLALGGTAGGVVSGISVATGAAVNPHLAVVFQGVNFRTHGFAYKFIARNSAESDTIRRLINTFKYHMHPSYLPGNLAFNYPDEFEIEFADSIAPHLYKIGTCVLTSMNVNYNGEATPLFFEDTQAPVSITIELQFQETAILTKDAFEKSERQQGMDQIGDPF